MIISISGNNEEYVTLAAEIAKELLSNLNCEIKSMKDMPNYRPNRQMFEGGEFDNWIITDCKTEQDMEVVNSHKGLTIFVTDMGKDYSLKDINVAKYPFPFLTERHAKDYLVDILVHEKLIYPTEQEA